MRPIITHCIFAAFAAAAAISLASAQEVTDAPATEPETNLLNLAEGAVLLSASANETAALSLTDGDPNTPWNNGGPRHPGPHVFVFELRTPTVLTHVGIDNAGPRPGGVAGGSAASIKVEASAQSADAGFMPVAAFLAAEDGETLAEAAPAGAVRWVRFTIESPHAADAVWVYFDEVIAHGAQEEPAPGRFTGVFETGPGAFVELMQSGASISGCYTENGGHSFGEISGDEVAGVARLRWESTDTDNVEGVALLVIDSRGNLNGVRYRHRSRKAWGGPPAPEGTVTPCSVEPVPENPIAEQLQDDGVARIYGILFDFDQATLKPASEPALRQLLAALSEDPTLNVAIEGHTDAMGSDTYNLELSQRRAASVVAWLTENGIDPARLTPVGKGETDPVATNDTADGRALNRRVEVRRL